MRALVFEKPGHVVVRDDLPDPSVEAPTDVVVRVTAAGLCGSDLHPYLGREAAATGVVPGHEAVGEVVAVGDDVRRHRVGDRVLVPFTTSCGACVPCRQGRTSRCVHGQLFGWGAPDGTVMLHGGQAQFVRVPLADGTAVEVPDGVDDATAVLLCDNLPTAWWATSRAGVRDGMTVAVVGLGGVGLCAVASAFALGAVEVLATDPIASRRDRAAALGATVVSGDEVAVADAVVEAAGPSAAQAAAVRMVRPGGTVSVVAVQTADRPGFDPATAYDRDVTVRFGRAAVRSALDLVLPRIAAGALVPPTDAVVTHPGLPLDDGPATYRRFADRTDDLVKATFDPW